MTGFQFSDETLDGLERIQGARSTRRGKIHHKGNGQLARAMLSGGAGNVRPLANRSQRAMETLERTTRRVPQAVVKVTGRIHGAGSVLGAFTYVARLGVADHEPLPLETSEGKLLARADEMQQLACEWQLHEMSDETRRKGATALAMVFSMPPGTDPDKVREAVREFAEQDMANRRWVMALHTDEPHPHVHLIVANRDQDGRRFNPDREFLANCRERFAENLRSRGVEVDATRRAARGFPPRRENIATQKVREREKRPLIGPRAVADRHRAENMDRVTSIYMRAIDELECHGGNSEVSCATALRGLVASMAITSPDREAAAPRMSDKSQAMLVRLAEVAEKVRASTAKLNEQRSDAHRRHGDVQLPRAADRLSQQAQKLEKMILDRQRTMHHDRERDVDPPPR
ncbi:relaxase/mobilization nuclease domain-containing protein [Sphingobium baderi]|uniref:relaxase/mobilization nuclease domain-containing protein n=1 Tax=Sphingobium baderi TaxID=1332080 RepID=UPI002B40AEAE|nr:relaxase/mobilization nuclease domain-containing protein [Sphingobium baderi]WRD75186.1 relaxase/mobilization nuclease domain-containing protein [Sphingobium baderi]